MSSRRQLDQARAGPKVLHSRTTNQNRPSPDKQRRPVGALCADIEVGYRRYCSRPFRGLRYNPGSRREVATPMGRYGHMGGCSPARGRAPARYYWAIRGGSFIRLSRRFGRMMEKRPLRSSGSSNGLRNRTAPSGRARRCTSTCLISTAHVARAATGPSMIRATWSLTTTRHGRTGD